MSAEQRIIASLNRQNTSLKAQKKFAWAKVYEGYREQWDTYDKVRKLRDELAKQTEDIPKHFQDLFVEMATELKKKFECPICLEDVERDTFAVSSCGHIYCKGCYDQLCSQEDPKCALCRRKLAKKD